MIFRIKRGLTSIITTALIGILLQEASYAPEKSPVTYEFSDYSMWRS